MSAGTVSGGDGKPADGLVSQTPPPPAPASYYGGQSHGLGSPLRIWTSGSAHVVARTVEEAHASAASAGLTREWELCADDDDVALEASRLTMGHPSEATGSVVHGVPMVTATAAQWLAHLEATQEVSDARDE